MGRLAAILLTVGAVLGGAGTTVAGATVQGSPAGGATVPGSPGGGSPASGLHVIPFPGTPDASRQSDVIFSSLTPSEIVSVAVTGSSSGGHTGTLRALPDAAGIAWVPDVPFSNSEQVSVTATLSSPAAGTASGAPGATTIRFAFRTATPFLPSPAGARGPVAQAASVADRAPASGPASLQKFVSEPGLHPVDVTATADPDQTSGDIFLTPRLTIHAPGRFGRHYHEAFMGGPMIINGRGQLVWFHPIKGLTYNLEEQRDRGQPVLTWWQKVTGPTPPEDVIADQSYRTVAVVHAGYGYKPDDHEFQLTPQGTALIDARVPVRADLSSVGGSATGVLIDYVIQELDVKTGQVLWEWHALGHIPLAATYYGPPKAGPYDDLHLNSIQRLPDGNLLISGRHTWGVYLIDKQTGKIIWTVGGKYSSFRLGPGAQFEWQHDAHLTGNTLTLFDDASKPGFEEEPQSSAKAIRLNASTRTATLIRRYTHYPPIITGSQGSAQPLPNGNMFVGWGASPSFSEYRASGRQIFNGSFPLGVESYRAYRFPWTGKPVGPPSLGVVPGSDGAVRVYASWNGATRVAAWRVLGGTTPKKLRSLGQIPDTGFESSLRLASEPPEFVVQALDAAGQVIGTSVDRPDPPHVAVFPPVAFVNTTTGSGSVAVGCFTKDPCHFALKLSSGGSVLAQRVVSGPVAPGTGTLVAFTLSHGGRRRLLTGRSGRGLRIRVQLSDGSSGPVARRSITLIPYTTSGARLPRQVSQSRA